METTNTKPDDKANENLEQIEENKKDRTILIKRVLFITIGILLLFLIILALLFAFKSEEEAINKVSSPIEKTAQVNENSVENISEEPQIAETKFDFNNLEPEKLNEQLELLTNKNMEHKQEKEKKIIEEEKKLSPIFNLVNNVKDKEEKEQEETPSANIETNINQEISSQNNTPKEELSKTLTTKEIEEATIQENSEKEKIVATRNETQIENNDSNKSQQINKTVEHSNFVKLINVAKIKGSLNKKYLDKVVDINSNILLCRDDENIIELYYGPFLEDSLREDLLSILIKNGFKEAYSLEMIKEEFDKRCNY